MNAITVNKDIQGGTPCFTGTRVPVSALYDYIKGNHSIEEFLADFPSVIRPQVDAVLDAARSDIPLHAVTAA